MTDSRLEMKRRSLIEERFKPRGTSQSRHLKSCPGRHGPSVALCSLAAEHIEIPPTSIRVNRTEAQLYCRK